ncbi:MAG: hypothetical protein EPN48_03530 [Microbacteriaceae bacterium]|nr:MAG: hypothetical protein EPN48_03530 [Microbacteriaceae bacterium]
MRVELLPTRSVFAVGAEVSVEVRGVRSPGTLTLWHLGVEVGQWHNVSAPVAVLGALKSGGYGVEWRGGDGTFARTAVDVADDSRMRVRYGFTVDYHPHRDARGLTDTVRRLHLTDIQFYDWAYRHADLLGGGDEYDDALGQRVSLDTVRELASAVHDVGARALGYAAVYAVGPAEWDRWRAHALMDGAGSPFALGDFLFIVDPAAERWVAHFVPELEAATGVLGFDGFHLDQYGYPKHARRADGVVVDVATSFDVLLRAVRDALPGSQLIFNNVNDFPTWLTGGSPQDAVYVEVWNPQTTLGALARVVSRARAVGEGKPVVIAAYQHVYDSASAAAADGATAFTMATLFSHGATQLLAGEADRILVDPYYVRNHVVEESTAALLKRWYDYLVEHDELLLDPQIVDVTGSYAGAYNDDIDVTFAGVEVTEEPIAGQVWRRVTRTRYGLVLHLINLSGQTDVLWDGAKHPVVDIGESTLRLRTVEGVVPRVRVSDPDRLPRLVEVPVKVDRAYASATLPTPGIWQLVLIDLDPDGVK